jgi:IS66 Orf2 like protein
MFFPEGSVRSFLHERPVDMRTSFDGLYALVKHVLGEDPLLCVEREYVAVSHELQGKRLPVDD